MKLGDLPHPRHAPLLWVSWVVAVGALVRLGCSSWPEMPLAERPGFAAAVELLRAVQGPDSFIVVWPPAVGRSARALPADLLAADAVPLEPESARQYTRILVVGLAGFPTPPELRAATPEPRRKLGDLEIGVFTFPSQDRLLFDLKNGIAEAKVSVRGPQANVECTVARPDRGWDCPGQPPWNNVSPTTLKVASGDWPCVWAHPFGGHDLTIDLGERVLGDRLELEAALTDDAAQTPNGASVSLRLEVDGVGVRSLTRTNSPGILRDTLATPRGRKAGVRLIVSTPSDGRRHFGVNLRIVEANPGRSGSGRTAP